MTVTFKYKQNCQYCYFGLLCCCSSNFRTALFHLLPRSCFPTFFQELFLHRNRSNPCGCWCLLRALLCSRTPRFPFLIVIQSVTLWNYEQFFISLKNYHVYLGRVCVHAQRSRTACRSWFSPSIMWVLKIKSSGLVSSTFIHWPILLTLRY